MKYLLITIILMFGLNGLLMAQEEYVQAYIDTSGDTVFMQTIPGVTILDKGHLDSYEERRNWWKLKRDVKTVYPYMIMAGEIYQNMETDLAEIDRRRQQKKYTRAKADELEAQFTDELKDLTTTQGKILVMLINRETGDNCYKLIKQLKSPIAAFMWQRMAKIWGYDLKAPYVPEDNPDIELILQMIESGQL